LKEEKDDIELIERINRIEKKLSKIQRESKVGLEDQLFFGLVVAIALFVITLPLDELTTFFQNIIKIDFAEALALSETIKNISIASLVLSCVLRYYGAIKPHKGARLMSFLSLVMGFDFFLLMFIINIAKGFAIEANPFTLPYSLIALVIIYLAIGKYVEGKIVNFYAKRGFVLKKYAKLPIVSYLFAILSFALYITLAIQFILAIYAKLLLDTLQLQLIFASIFCAFAFLYIIRLKREKILRFK